MIFASDFPSRMITICLMDTIFFSNKKARPIVSPNDEPDKTSCFHECLQTPDFVVPALSSFVSPISEPNREEDNYRQDKISAIGSIPEISIPKHFFPQISHTR